MRRRKTEDSRFGGTETRLLASTHHAQLSPKRRRKNWTSIGIDWRAAVLVAGWLGVQGTWARWGGRDVLRDIPGRLRQRASSTPRKWDGRIV